MQLVRQHRFCHYRSLHYTSISSILPPYFHHTTPLVMASSTSQGDLDNTAAARPTVAIAPDLTNISRSLAIEASEDDPRIRKAYRPFMLSDEITKADWVAKLELSTALKMVEQELKRSNGDRIKVLVLFGSMRRR